MIIDRVGKGNIYLESTPGDHIDDVADRANEHGFPFLLFNDRIYYITESRMIIPTTMTKEHMC